MPLLSELVSHLDQFAPPHLAAEWDNTGLLLGDPAAPVERILTCLTLTADVAAEAVAEGAHLVVAHHPILFRGAKKLTADRGDGAVVWPLAKAGIAVYSPHTSFDNCVGGINDILCRRLGILKAVPLRAVSGAKQFKLVVFVPDADLSKVSDAVFATGAGVIGQYEQCSFRLAGKGTFFGTGSTNPVVGEKGRREDVDEWRLEVVVPESKLPAVVKALRAAHSYEEPAFDVYPLHPASGGGEGRVGELQQTATLGELAVRVKTALNAGFLQTVGEALRPIHKVAVACGAAGEFLPDAIRAGADAFLTGEMRFHDALAARAAGIAVLLPGHYATERPGIEELAAKLSTEWPSITTWASRVERDPLNSLSSS